MKRKKKVAVPEVKVGLSAPDPWRARNDMRTMMDAEEIKKDPRRHRAARAEAKKQMQMAARVARLEKEPL